MTKITSSAQLKAALGIPEPRAPRRQTGGTPYPHVMRHDAQIAAANAAAGFATSSAEVRARLGLPGAFKPRQLPYDQTVRLDALPPPAPVSHSGPVRSSAELRAPRDAARMSAVAFGNRGGWQHWRLMDDERRQHEEARTFRAVAEMLEEESRADFPDHPVVWDRAEVPWETCDIAFGFAKNMRGDAAMMDKWLASLVRARRYVEDQHAAFLRGGDPPPLSNGPSRFQRDRDRAALERLEVPLVLVTPRRAPAVAVVGHG